MKRFLVCLMGDRDTYLSSHIVAQVDKAGEPDIKHLIYKSCGSSGVETLSPYSTVRYVYKIIYGENRKDVLDEDEMRLLYATSIQKYNES